MSGQTVDHIIELIDQLPWSEQVTLAERLAERTEAAWQAEAEQARQEAQARGVDQATIDDAVAAHRYGA